MALPDNPNRIAVFRALQLGDLLCSAPALRALRRGYPSAEITLVGLPWAREFVERFHDYLDAFVEFPGHPGLPEREPDAAAWEPFLDRMRSSRFDLAIQLHGSGSIVNPIVASFGAARTAGFHPGDAALPDQASFIPWPGDRNEIDRYLALTAHLGLPSDDRSLEFPLTPRDFDDLTAQADLAALRPGSYVCIHPGARLRSRRWLPERFAAVARELSADGTRIVLTGTRDELPLVSSIAAAIDPPPLVAADRTSLGAMAVLVSRARLLVTNDTGASHIAAALQVPSVVVACGSDVDRWRPIDTSRHRVAFADIECRPCAYDECPVGHPCATRVDAAAVLKHARALLAR